MTAGAENRIVYVAGDREGFYDLYTVRPDASEGRAIFSVRRDLKRHKRIVGTRRGLGVFDW